MTEPVNPAQREMLILRYWPQLSYEATHTHTQLRRRRERAREKLKEDKRNERKRENSSGTMSQKVDNTGWGGGSQICSSSPDNAGTDQQKGRQTDSGNQHSPPVRPTAF